MMMVKIMIIILLFIPLLPFRSTKASRRLSWTKPRGVLWISSDSDYPRIFLGLKFSISGFFWGRKIIYIFW